MRLSWWWLAGLAGLAGLGLAAVGLVILSPAAYRFAKGRYVEGRTAVHSWLQPSVNCTADRGDGNGLQAASAQPAPDGAAVATLPARTAGMWETVTYEIVDETIEGDPFDTDAAATFTHADTGETITTGFFYDGGDSMKFRFTGTLEGDWRFATRSSDADLDGRAGEIQVTPSDRLGPLTVRDGQFARMIDANTYEAAFLNIFMDTRHAAEFEIFMASRIGSPTDRGRDAWPPRTKDYVAEVAKEAKALGFGSVFASHVGHAWLAAGAESSQEHHSVEPDPETFRTIEAAIETAHDLGVNLHLWMWADRQRRQSPNQLPCGAGGVVDRRLQDYIAARLGPLPGWSMGYGFDLHEWASEAQVAAWAETMQTKMGWEHILTARDRNVGPLRVHSHPWIGHSYADALRNETEDPRHAHLFEERDVLGRRSEGRPEITMEFTQDALWGYALAGGHGGFWGYGFGAAPERPYPEPDQIRTFHAFFAEDDRFELGARADNSIVGNGIGLRSKDGEHLVVYANDAKRVELDLPKGRWRVTAVNADQSYAEDVLGDHSGATTLDMPERADWAFDIDLVGPGDAPQPAE